MESLEGRFRGNENFTKNIPPGLIFSKESSNKSKFSKRIFQRNNHLLKIAIEENSTSGYLCFRNTSKYVFLSFFFNILCLMAIGNLS